MSASNRNSYGYIIVPNRKELNKIIDTDEPMEQKADLLLSYRIQTVIITLGADGFYIKGNDICAHFPAIEVTSIDVSGAEDAFISALVSYLIYGYDILTASRIANYAAGLSTTRQGTVPVFVDKNTLESYIQIMDPGLLK